MIQAARKTGRFRVSLKWLLLASGLAPILLAALLGGFGPDVQVVTCFDALLVIAMLWYTGLYERRIETRSVDPPKA